MSQETLSLSLDHVSPVTRFLDKETQMKEVQRALDLQKKEYARQDEAFKRREETLKKRDLELQEALVLFNKFLKRNETKRRRADQQAKKTAQERRQLQVEIAAKEKELRAKKERMLQLERRLADLQPYDDYLKYVTSEASKTGGQFSTERDVINRYETLRSEEGKLERRQDERNQELEALRQRYFQLHKKLTSEHLSANNTIAYDSKRLEELTKDTQNLEEKKESAQAKQTDDTKALQEIMATVRNLMERCNQRPESSSEPGQSQVRLSHASALTGNKEFAHANEAKRTRMRLDVLAKYIKDFSDIIEQGREQTHKTLPHGVLDDRGAERDSYGGYPELGDGDNGAGFGADAESVLDVVPE